MSNIVTKPNTNPTAPKTSPITAPTIPKTTPIVPPTSPNTPPSKPPIPPNTVPKTPPMILNGNAIMDPTGIKKAIIPAIKSIGSILSNVYPLPCKIFATMAITINVNIISLPPSIHRLTSFLLNTS